MPLSPRNPSPLGEFGLIAWMRGQVGSVARPGVVLGIGDDAAILRPTPGTEQVVTTDMLMDGRHFRLESQGPEAVGYKALAVNVSDIAAMAARPVAAVVAVALPLAGGRAAEIAKGLYVGLSQVAERYQVALIGGDTNAWDGPLVVSVTVLGESAGRGCVRRSGALPGDVIFVTGPLGGSLRGRHLRPTARVDEALALNALVPIHAMIDVSDGLVSDLGHILEESGDLGAVIEEPLIPVHADAVVASGQDGRSPLDHALADGEDFELCLTVDPGDADLLESSLPRGFPLIRVGTIDAKPGVRLRRFDGKTTRLALKGFDHLDG